MSVVETKVSLWFPISRAEYERQGLFEGFECWIGNTERDEVNGKPAVEHELWAISKVIEDWRDGEVLLGLTILPFEDLEELEPFCYFLVEDQTGWFKGGPNDGRHFSIKTDGEVHVCEWDDGTPCADAIREHVLAGHEFGMATDINPDPRVGIAQAMFRSIAHGPAVL